VPSGYVVFLFLEKSVLVHRRCVEKFRSYFHWCLEGNVITYDNLINIVIMVKDAGDGFRDVLLHNLQYCEFMTILDTGSTDGTLDVIREVVTKDKGILYERRWKNFRDSRNELLDLAGDKYVFNIMLDDTYRLHGNVREFLAVARSDEDADSYSIFIKDSFSMYSSNRIFKPVRNIRYRYTIHEIPEANANFEIPVNIMWITDEHSTYMSERTKDRKKSDLKFLFDEYARNPSDPRSLYYLGETYLCLKDWENAYKYYELRYKSEPKGFSQEVQDSLYKMGTIAYFNLHKDWEFCENIYRMCFNVDQNRPEALYIIGYHYDSVNESEKAYTNLLKAWEVAKMYVPTTMNSRHKISRYDIPNLLLKYCLQYGNYKTGLECVLKCKEHAKDYSVAATNLNLWHSIFLLCTESLKTKTDEFDRILFNGKKTICMVAPGGWVKWDGETLSTKGLGGSETCIVRYAETMSSMFEEYSVVVFCNCEKSRFYKGVVYIDLSKFVIFVSCYRIEHCIIHRHPVYIPVCALNQVKNIYLMLHDLTRHGEIIYNIPSLKNVICLSDWHIQTFLQAFPRFTPKMLKVSYGIEVNTFKEGVKRPYSFIYPSFPNRGLKQLLEMFPMIKRKYPSATLDVFCDMDNDWANKYHKDTLASVRKLLIQPGVVNHGWVSESTLKRYWGESQVWLYPCVFPETFCRVALEAAASKTFVIASGLAALRESAVNGVIIPGDPRTQSWKDEACEKLFYYLDNPSETQRHVKVNYKWAQSRNYENAVRSFCDNIGIS
jgi:glycosyltransferase involved in cell wall biosynthesis